MLIKESHIDVPTKADGEGNMRKAPANLIPNEGIFLHHPTIPSHPRARFPGVVLFSEIYQVTGPVARLARQIAGRGYIVAALSSYHEFTGPEALSYDNAGTDAGNKYKKQKTLGGYDEDAKLTVDALIEQKTCNGMIGAAGMCLGGHLALRCCVTESSRVKAGMCWFATDLQYPSSSSERRGTLGKGGDDTLQRVGECGGEVIMVHGKLDNHVPPAARDLIRRRMHEEGVNFSWYEIAGAQHAFIRDELSKGRYDPPVADITFEMMMELFGRTLRSHLGERDDGKVKVEDVC
ncbi:MAG: hypothetical protein OHK93_007262 [Ramalina farinacea]|uniref:Dienelactone hydrolase domain-containing protein n=1 Tax=Ramalina farinacea TaxID=258253 RepID=A0AA43QNJ7_9LECA|nr:hypothetical protein [Ramalina farinacea]